MESFFVALALVLFPTQSKGITFLVAPAPASALAPTSAKMRFALVSAARLGQTAWTWSLYQSKPDID